MTIPTTTDVLIVGGGPAGSLLGCLLARRGIDVVVIEKQAGLERDFRGETLAAPSAVTLRRLGFEPALAEHGYLETSGVVMKMEGRRVFEVDYGRFPTGTLPIDMPQPALIGIFNDAARAFPNFTYSSSTSFTGLLETDGVVTGATVKTRDGSRVEVRARVVVGADGRFSKVRKASGLDATVEPMARDFLSFKLTRPEGWGNRAELLVRGDKHLVVLPTFPNFLRIGHNLPKRGMGELRKAGFDAFKAGIMAVEPRLEPLVEAELRSWEDTSFLEIFTAEMAQWAREGLILIGDASHTCTPILGQGVNLAIQDCVCVAPVIAGALAADPTGAPVPAAAFDAFVAARRRHKGFVTRFQRMQESALTHNTPVRMLARRARFRTLDKLPLKYRLFDRVINAQHDIDAEDLRLAAEAAPRTPARAAE